jgi:hypothetical protein
MKYKSEPAPEVYDEYGTFWDELLLIGNIVLDNDNPPRSYRNALTYMEVDFSAEGNVIIVYKVNLNITFTNRDNGNGVFWENIAFEMIYDRDNGFLVKSFGLMYDH